MRIRVRQDHIDKGINHMDDPRIKLLIAVAKMVDNRTAPGSTIMLIDMIHKKVAEEKLIQDRRLDRDV
jgi:hypothetical protein